MIHIKPQKITVDDFWADSVHDSIHQSIIDRMAKQIAKDIDEQLLGSIISGSFMNHEQKTEWIVKHGMEKEFGMTFEQFKEAYEKLVRDNPEKLI